MTKKIPDFFCILPWISVTAKPDGRIFPCCHNSQPYQKNGEDLYLYKDSLSDGYHSEIAKKLRANHLNGVKDESCDLCWQEEACGKKSRRHFENHDFLEECEQVLAGEYKISHPIFLDISPGTLCNLKCRICSPAVSSKWEQEADDLGLPDKIFRNNAELKAMTVKDSRRTILSWPEKNLDFWTDLEKWLPDIKRFAFYGGEPFLNRRHFELLGNSVAAGHSKRQTLRYNSNGTIFPKHAMENLFPHFQDVQIFLSIDDIGARFEYQRSGAKWDEVLENVRKFLRQEKVRIGICITVNAFNIFSLLDTLDFWLEENAKVFISLLHGPASLGICALPEEAKKKLIYEFCQRDISKYDKILLNQLEPIFSYLESRDDSALWPDFVNEVRRHDEYRKENCAAIFPLLAPYLTHNH